MLPDARPFRILMTRKLLAIGYAYLERFRAEDPAAALPFLEACARVVSDCAARMTQEELRGANPVLWSNLLQSTKTILLIADANSKTTPGHHRP